MVTEDAHIPIDVEEKPSKSETCLFVVKEAPLEGDAAWVCIKNKHRVIAAKPRRGAMEAGEWWWMSKSREEDSLLYI